MNKINRERYLTAMLEWERKKYPNTPERYLVPDKTNDKDANSLTKCIINYLRATGSQAERINNMGRPVERVEKLTNVLGQCREVRSIKWIKGSGQRGTADISAVIKGKAVKIEVKWGRDRQSADQRQYQQEIEAADGIYWIVRTMDEFFEKYDNLIKRL